MRLTENKLKEFINEAIQEVIVEKSISQKKRDNKDMERSFRSGNGGFNNIKSLVVFTAENPNSVELKRCQNKKLNKSLLSVLNDAGYKFVPAIGQFYGNPEHPYVVFNMSLVTAKRLCGRYEQTSFVWSEIGRDGNVFSQYWEKQNKTSPYNRQSNDYACKDECDTWIDQSEAEDGFTILGKEFKYSVPFSIFENVNKKFGENLQRLTEQRFNDKESSDDILDFAMNGVGQSPFLYRKAIIRDC